MNPQIEELRAEQEQIQQEIEQLEHQQVLIENKIDGGMICYGRTD